MIYNNNDRSFWKELFIAVTSSAIVAFGPPLLQDWLDKQKQKNQKPTKKAKQNGN